jgi:hypothetical protein
MNHIRAFILVLSFIFVAQPLLFAQEEQTVYYIRTIDFTIQGRTRPFALLFNAEMQEGDQLTGFANLQQYLDRKTQLLINQRSLASAAIAYSIGQADADGRVPVDLMLHTADTWNFVILPRPQYDSNSGLDITIKARDYNFLGTMSPLRIDLGYQYNNVDDTKQNYEKHSFNLLIDSDTPFKAFGFKWNFDFDNAFGYTQDEPLSYKNITGISMELPWRQTTFTFGFEEGTVLNEENSMEDQIEYGVAEYAGWYMYSKLYSYWKIPTEVKFANLGALTYTPGIEGKWNYRVGGIDEVRKGPTLTFSHTLGFEQVDWIENENFRKGASLMLGNTYTYNFKYLSENRGALSGWTSTLTFTGAGYVRLSKLFGISGRLSYRQWFFNDAHNALAGDMLRGILDKNISADTMLSLNLDFPFRLIRFVPSEWFSAEKLWIFPMKTFNFELHVSPIFDLALAKDSTDNLDNKVGPNYRWYVTGGLEIIVFPLSWRSFYLRISPGYNLREIVNNKKLSKWYGDELFIGIGHFY